MSLLEDVQTGKQQGPRRIMLYGTHGIGKSTFASRAPSPIFIQTEDGLGGIDCCRFPLASTSTFDGVIAALTELLQGKHSYKTIVIDSLDWLEQVIWQDVCKANGVESIEKIGYAKGYTFALVQWRRVLAGLSALRSQRGMTAILTAHSTIEKFENPQTETYSRYTPKLHKHASAVMQEWCDEVLFAHHKVMVRKEEEGFNKERARPVDSNQRVISTVEKPFNIAKNRLDLPDEIPLSWAEFAKYLPENITTTKKEKTNGKS